MKNLYEYGILLIGGNKYCDITSCEAVIAQKRPFKLFRWEENAKLYLPAAHWDPENQCKIVEDRMIDVGCWKLLFFCISGKWKAYDKPNDFVKEESLMAMHLFFKSIDELKEWLGEVHYLNLFMDIL